jgi:hypothetical protein
MRPGSISVPCPMWRCGAEGATTAPRRTASPPRFGRSARMRPVVSPGRAGGGAGRAGARNVALGVSAPSGERQPRPATGVPGRPGPPPRVIEVGGPGQPRAPRAGTSAPSWWPRHHRGHRGGRPARASRGTAGHSDECRNRGRATGRAVPGEPVAGVRPRPGPVAGGPGQGGAVVRGDRRSGSSSRVVGGRSRAGRDERPGTARRRRVIPTVCAGPIGGPLPPAAGAGLSARRAVPAARSRGRAAAVPPGRTRTRERGSASPPGSGGRNAPSPSPARSVR